MKATFFINIMIRLRKKEQSDHCRVIAEKKQHCNGSIKYKIPQPSIHINWILWMQRQVKIWIKVSTLTTFSSKIWWRLKSPTIRILCFVGNSLINKIKCSVKGPRRPCIQYTIINNKVSFSISSTTGNTSKILEISIKVIPNSQVVKKNYTR